MSCPFLHNQLINATLIKPSVRPDPTVGQQICFYDQIFTWTDKHVPPSKLNQWRKHGDSLIDQFFQEYGEQLQANDDTYEYLEHFLVTNPLNTSCLIKFSEYIRQRPIWFNREQILHGQKFFLKNLPSMLTTIVYHTLVIGYGFQQLNNILIKTNYLLSNDLKESHRRLVETLQMIATAICGDIDQFDETFSDVIRVRLLHGMFSFSSLFCIEQHFHISLSHDEKEAYLHFWRYIGWLIGIDEQYLIYLSSYELAETISQPIFYHFYLPSQTLKHMIHHTLMSSYFHGELPLSFRFHLGISQILQGEQVSQALQIDQPKSDHLHFYTIQFLFQIFRLI
ncbi:hypothetical protein I4U23_011049 [Adineta vaga]|nr:hypothetical protein I4U23_011049 [Adineta vaga]